MVKLILVAWPVPVFPAFSGHFPLRTGADLAQNWRRKRHRTALGGPLRTWRLTPDFEREKPIAHGVDHAGPLPTSPSAMTAAALRRRGASDASSPIISYQDGVFL